MNKNKYLENMSNKESECCLSNLERPVIILSDRSNKSKPTVGRTFVKTMFGLLKSSGRNNNFKKILFFAINPFVFTLLQPNVNYDIHPTAWNELYHFITTTTSIECEKEIKRIEADKIYQITEEMFSSPLLILTGTAGFTFSEKNIKALNLFFSAGGLLFIDNAISIKNSEFDKSVKKELEKLFPNQPLKKIENSHALFYSFYLLPKVSGVKIISADLYGIENNNNHLSIIYSQNNLLGIWERDKLGNWLYECKPGGEKQRLEAMKLTMNIIMYALTGSYKLDAIHSPFIKQKLLEFKK